MKNTVVINLFGEPGAGKSTAASYIFGMLRMKGVKCEYVSEFAKDMVWDDNFKALANQPFVFGSQSYRLSRVRDEVDVIVTDCPLLLSAVYNRDLVFANDKTLHEKFKEVVIGVFDTYNNINILLKRQHPYESSGRHESEAEAEQVRKLLQDTFHKYDIEYEDCPAQLSNYDEIVSRVITYLAENQSIESKVEEIIQRPTVNCFN